MKNECIFRKKRKNNLNKKKICVIYMLCFVYIKDIIKK